MTLYAADLAVSQIGVESTPGTPVPANILPGNLKIMHKTAGDPSDAYRGEGQLYEYGVSSGMEWGAGTYESPVEAFGSKYIYDSHFERATPSGTTSITRVWDPAVAAAEVYDTYTLEKGQAGAVEIFPNLIFNTVKWLISKRERCTITGDTWSRAVSSIASSLTSATRVPSSVIARTGFNVYTGATFGARTTLVDMARAEINHGPRYKDAALINTNLGPDGLVPMALANSCRFTVPMSVSAGDYAGPFNNAKKRAGTPIFITIVGTGKLITGVIYEEHEIALCVTLRNTPDNGAIDGNVDGRVWDAGLSIDPTSGKAIRVTTISAP